MSSEHDHARENHTSTRILATQLASDSRVARENSDTRVPFNLLVDGSVASLIMLHTYVAC